MLTEDFSYKMEERLAFLFHDYYSKDEIQRHKRSFVVENATATQVCTYKILNRKLDLDRFVDNEIFL